MESKRSFNPYANPDLHPQVRLAYMKLTYGMESKRFINAKLTLANAYLDLRAQPKQALRHAKQARDLFQVFDSAMPHAPVVG